MCCSPMLISLVCYILYLICLIFLIRSSRLIAPPLPQIGIIGAMVIVRRVREKIISSVLWNNVRHNCAQCDAHT